MYLNMNLNACKFLKCQISAWMLKNKTDGYTWNRQVPISVKKKISTKQDVVHLRKSKQAEALSLFIVHRCSPYIILFSAVWVPQSHSTDPHRRLRCLHTLTSVGNIISSTVQLCACILSWTGNECTFCASCYVKLCQHHWTVWTSEVKSFELGHILRPKSLTSSP